MIKYLPIALIAIVVIGVGYLLTQTSSNQPLTATETQTINTSESGDTIASQAQYIDYSPDALAQAQQKGRAVLFFHADWCPTCRALDKEIKLPSGSEETWR
jgi:thiol:disulfide interchange protein